VTDLLIRGGTVVTAAGSRRAEIAVAGDRIERIETDLGGITNALPL
jgi:dihydroorotase-like cyclic amidohydrolase